MRELDVYIKEFMRGDTHNFPIFYEETKKTVFFSILNIIKSEIIAEDIMQDTYVRFLENLSSYRLGTNIKAYLATMSRNLAINEYNKRKKELINEEVIDYLSNHVKEYSGVFELLKYVTDDEREVIILHIIDNLKFREIAKVINKPLGTVLWLYNKGIKTLKERRNEL